MTDKQTVLLKAKINKLVESGACASGGIVLKVKEKKNHGIRKK